MRLAGAAPRRVWPGLVLWICGLSGAAQSAPPETGATQAAPTASAASAPSANTTAVELTIVGGTGLNPNSQGRPSPVVVRIFQLSGAKGFAAADYPGLFEHPGDPLQHEILRQEELVLRPGDIQQRTLELPSAALELGVAAAFRDLEHALWHLSVPVKPGRRNFLLVDLDQDRIRIETGDESRQ